MYVKLFTFFIFVFALLFNNNNQNNHKNNNKNNNNCIMISFGGYSGFWYYYGYLQNNYVLDKPIYCYSAGCLSVVSHIQHNNNKSLYRIVEKLKKDYSNNKLDRIKVREKFIEEISINIPSINSYNINILTSNYFGNCNIKKPKTNSELVRALNETTSVPLITSKFDFDYNIDGFFCLNKYPKCNIKLSVPWKYEFWINMLNPNLNRDTINFFIKYNLLIN